MIHKPHVDSNRFVWRIAKSRPTSDARGKCGPDMHGYQPLIANQNLAQTMKAGRLCQATLAQANTLEGTERLNNRELGRGIQAERSIASPDLSLAGGCLASEASSATGIQP